MNNLNTNELLDINGGGVWGDIGTALGGAALIGGAVVSAPSVVTTAGALAVGVAVSSGAVALGIGAGNALS